MKTNFKLVISHEEEKLDFTFRQLTYREKNTISALTTTFKQGRAVVDSSLICFYVIKFGLIDVKGLLNSDGSEWKLEKDEHGNNSDSSIDALLNTQVSNALIFSANAMLEGIPTKIMHPLTGLEIQGVEIIKLSEDKKKS